jgi:hypothetical protein
LKWLLSRETQALGCYILPNVVRAKRAWHLEARVELPGLMV